jgi:GGDEF domain-containing protein
MNQEYRPPAQGLERNDLGTGMASSLLLLVEALASHAIHYDADYCTSYQRRMRDSCEKLKNAADGKAAVALAAQTIELVQNQTQAVEQFISGLTSEKQAIIHLITESLIKVCTRSESTAQNLRALEKELASASQVEEIRSLKDKMASVLDSICREAKGQEEQLKELGPVVAELRKNKAAPDQVTGLPGTSDAEEMFRAASQAGRPAYVVALTIRNLDVLNRRISFSAGNKLLVTFGREIAQRLSANDRLFRWRGPCFVAVLRRDAGLMSVRQEAAKFNSISQERTIEDNHSSLFFKMAIAWRVFSMPPVADLHRLSDQIDAFLLGDAPRDQPA